MSLSDLFWPWSALRRERRWSALQKHWLRRKDETIENLIRQIGALERENARLRQCTMEKK